MSGDSDSEETTVRVAVEASWSQRAWVTGMLERAFTKGLACTKTDSPGLLTKTYFVEISGSEATLIDFLRSQTMAVLHPKNDMPLVNWMKIYDATGERPPLRYVALSRAVAGDELDPFPGVPIGG